MHIGEGMEVKDPESTQEPQNRRDNDDSIENGLDVGLHGDESVDKPQQKSHDDQSYNYLD
jgi:hypothetical protein